MGMTKLNRPLRYRLVLAMGVSDSLPILDAHYLTDMGATTRQRDFSLVTSNRLATGWIKGEDFQHWTYTDGWQNLPHLERLEMLQAVQPHLTLSPCTKCRDDIAEMIADLSAILTDPRYDILMRAFEHGLALAGYQSKVLRPELAALAQRTIVELDETTERLRA